MQGYSFVRSHKQKCSNANFLIYYLSMLSCSPMLSTARQQPPLIGVLRPVRRRREKLILPIGRRVLLLAAAAAAVRGRAQPSPRRGSRGRARRRRSGASEAEQRRRARRHTELEKARAMTVVVLGSERERTRAGAVLPSQLPWQRRSRLAAGSIGKRGQLLLRI